MFVCFPGGKGQITVQRHNILNFFGWSEWKEETQTTIWKWGEKFNIQLVLSDWIQANSEIVALFVKKLVQHFEKYTYSQSWRELDEKIDTTHGKYEACSQQPLSLALRLKTAENS